MIIAAGVAIPFTAFWIKGKKNMKLLTSFYSNSEMPAREDTTNDEGERNVVQCTVPVARRAYLLPAGGVDRANAGILAYEYPHRVMNWDVSLFLWCFRLIVHNAHILYQVVNDCHLPLHQFVKMLVNEMAPPPEPEIDEDLANHITESKVSEKQPTPCVLCRLKKKKSNTTHWCKGCHRPMHKKCARDANGQMTDLHFRYCLRKVKHQTFVRQAFNC